MAEQFEMISETLAVKEVGPLEVQVFGAKNLCIEAGGDANLAPFTATVRLRNTGAAPLILGYTMDPLRSFRSTAVWPTERPDAAMEFSDCVGDVDHPTAMEKTLPPQGDLLLSSWTRHHSHIWDREAPRDSVPLTELIPRDYTVRFALSLTYDRGTGVTAVSEMMDLRLRSVPVSMTPEET